MDNSKNRDLTKKYYSHKIKDLNKNYSNANSNYEEKRMKDHTYRRATVPGRYLWGFFTPPVVGADLRAAYKNGGGKCPI